MNNEACWSLPLPSTTGKWGDAAPLFDGDDPGAPQPDFNDIAAVVQKFVASPTAPITAFAQLQPNVAFPGRPADFKNIAVDVAAFAGTANAEMEWVKGPCTCPSSVTCGATACANDTECGDGSCLDSFCTDACGRCTP